MKFRLGTICLMLFLVGSTAFAGSFTDNGNGTVSDATTGLTWQQTDDATKRNWQSALEYCSALTLAGKTDWHLPEINDLETLIDRSNRPSIDHVKFPGAISSNYLSSTTFVSPNSAWYVSFSNGFVGNVIKTSNHYVRCVR